MAKIKNIILRIHLATLIILLINLIINVVFEISLIANIRLVLKILLYVSACILFFYYVKPFKKRALYFSIYIFSPVFIFFSWLINKTLGTTLASIFIFCFCTQNDIRFENEKIQIKKEFRGLEECCTYKVTQEKYYLFEKKLSEFQFERNLYFRKEDIKIKTDTLKMDLILKYYDEKDHHYFAKDTTIYTLLK
ncbi:MULTISPECIES: hypothetical protein [Flavobacterium]|uniref:Uncharacterized protein n=1 Tax=Flavobacterium panici TaxID=2654843 RepID=A0A9N8P0T6_9FLAO|nr:MULTISPECIES: hypothetical protein [Flavobacterium]UUF15150.1 hypothetical protein NLJ00_03370 [Flavobacterium panici]CAC9973411.1 hypothetical protein FLAPXU55_01093 [Flavobacterium panici]